MRISRVGTSYSPSSSCPVYSVPVLISDDAAVEFSDRIAATYLPVTEIIRFANKTVSERHEEIGGLFRRAVSRFAIRGGFDRRRKSSRRILRVPPSNGIVISFSNGGGVFSNENVCMTQVIYIFSRACNFFNAGTIDEIFIRDVKVRRIEYASFYKKKLFKSLKIH